jgi:hypothetical protein
MSGALQAVFQNQRSFGTPPGQACFCNIGTATYTWTVPTGVTKISVLLVGAGGYGYCGYRANVVCPCCPSGNYTYVQGGGGGGGGALGYKNNYCVTPGTQYKIKFTASSPNSNTCVVFATSGCSPIFSVRNARGGSGTNGGAGGAASSSAGVQLSFSGGTGGQGSVFFVPYNCYGDIAAGGGASSGGYGGPGKNGSASGTTCGGTVGCFSPGSGAGGITSRGGGGGGGVGRYGNATGTANGAAGASNGGGGGGANGGGDGGSTTSVTGGAGGSFGGGGGGGGVSFTGSIGSYGLQGKALIRILWPGCARSYPATRTADE